MSLPEAPSPLTRDVIEAHIAGQISGQVTVGNNNLQVGSIHGGVVNIAVPGQQPRPRPRPVPVVLRPGVGEALLGREAEAGRALALLDQGRPVELHGEAGVGKTALLTHLAHHPGGPFAEAVVYLRARRQLRDDVLQWLFDAFYTCEVPFKPPPAELRHHLSPLRALILLDDVDLERDDLHEVLAAAPGCAVAVASTTRRLWGQGRSWPLEGLSSEAAVELLERELDRPMRAEERPAAVRLCQALTGHPLRVLQAAASCREEGRSLADLAAEAEGQAGAATLTAGAVTSLDEGQRQVIAALAAADEAPLRPEHLAAITGRDDVEEVLASLLSRKLVQAHSPRYSLAAPLDPNRSDRPGAGAGVERHIVYWAAWGEQHRGEPGRVAAEAEPMEVALAQAGALGRWREVLRLVEALDGALALSGRWAAWEAALGHARTAARNLADRAKEGWALHQLGVRALCLGDESDARRHLDQALAIRRALGDGAGAEVTRYHLDLLRGPPPPPPRGPGPPSPPPPRPPAPVGAGPVPRSRSARPLVAAVAAATVVGTLALLALLVLPDKPSRLRAAIRAVELAAEPTRVDFGTARVGTRSTPASVTVSNGQSRPIRVGPLRVVGADAGDFLPVSDTCSDGVVAGGGRCSVSLVFAPTGTGGRSASLLLTRAVSGHQAAVGGSPVRLVLAAPEAPLKVALSGVAPVAGVTVLTADPFLIDFGDQPVRQRSRPRPVTLTNASRRATRVDAVALGGSDGPSFTVEAGACRGRALGPGESCRLGVVFTPGAVGGHSASLLVDHGGERLSVALVGTGAAGALIADPSFVDFGRQPVGSTSPSRAVTLTNVGTAPLVVQDAGIAGNDAPRFLVKLDGCSRTTLAPTRRCSIEVSFSPAAAGARLATLVVAHRGGELAVGLSGSGEAGSGSLRAEPRQLGFPDQGVDTASEAKAVAVTNPGDGPVLVSQPAVGSGEVKDFRITSDGCSGSRLSPGASCTIEVAFTPSGLGPRQGTLSIPYAGGALAVPLTGRGISAADLVLELTRSPQDASVWIFTVTNKGPSPATEAALTVSPGPGSEVSMTPADKSSESICSGGTSPSDDVGTGTVTCSFGTIAPGDQVRVRLFVTGCGEFTAVAGSRKADPVSRDNQRTGRADECGTA